MLQNVSVTAFIVSELSRGNSRYYENSNNLDIMKIVKSLKESDWLIKIPSKTIKNEAKEKKEDLSECYYAL